MLLSKLYTPDGLGLRNSNSQIFLSSTKIFISIKFNRKDNEMTLFYSHLIKYMAISDIKNFWTS